MLSVLAGSRMQLCMMTLVSLVFVCLGFLSPNCEAILTTVLVLYVFLGMVAEYVSACPYKTTVLRWKNNVLMIVFLYLGNVFGILFHFDLISWSYYSAAALLFTTLLAWLLSFQHLNMDLDFSVIPVRIFRNQFPLVFKPGTCWPVRVWFIKIDPVQIVSIRVCACVCLHVCLCVRPRGY